MAARRSSASGPVVTPLEHQVPVTWTAVGTSKWFEQAWAPGELTEQQKVVVTRWSDLDPIKQQLLAMPVVGLDTETSGPYKANDRTYSMNPQNPDTRLVLVQLGNADQVFLLQPELVTYFKDVLESDQIVHVGHNLSYDFKWLLVKHQIHLQRLYCTMLAEQVLTAGLPAMRVTLADSVRRRSPYWIINKAVRDQFVHFDHSEGCPDCNNQPKKLTREMAYYAGRDIVLLFPLMQEQQQQLAHWHLTDTAQLEFDIIAATAEMEIGGVNLYLPVIDQVIEYWKQQEKDLSDEFSLVYAQELQRLGKNRENLIPGMDFNLNLKSGPAKLQALRELDIDLDNVQRKTLQQASKGIVEKKKGKKTIEMKMDFTPAQRRLLEILGDITKAFKYTSTYGQNLKESISATTGRWHPRFRQLGSGEELRRSGSDDKGTIATGRMSSDAQQFPKPEERFGRVVHPAERDRVMAHFAADIAAAQATAAAAA